MYGVSKISSEQNIMLTTFPGAQYSAQSLAEHLDVFAKAGIVVDMICQSTPRGSAVDFSFTTSYDNFAAVMKALPAAAKADARTTKIALRRAAARTLPAASAARTRTLSGRMGTPPRCTAPLLMQTAIHCAPAARTAASWAAWPLWKGSYSAIMPVKSITIGS